MHVMLLHARQHQQAQVARAALRETERFLAQLAQGSDDDPSLGRIVLDLFRQSKPDASARIPFALLQRDLVTSSGGAGGYLVGTGMQPVQSLFREKDWLKKLGVTVVNPKSACTIPAVTTAVTASWLANETTTMSGVQPTTGQIAMTPKHAGISTIVSHQWLLQVDQGIPFVREQCMAALDTLLAAAVISGTGASGQPTGIVNYPNVTTQSGTTLGHTGLRTMRRKIIEAGGVEDNIVWVGGAAAQDVLGGRELASTGGGRFCWDTDGILGRPAYASAFCTSDTLVAGDWSRCIVSIFGDVFTLEVNPYQDFQAGRVGVRMLVEADIGFGPPKAFSVSTSVT